MNLFLYQVTYLLIAVGYLIFILFSLQKKRMTILNYKAHVWFILVNIFISIWATGRYILLITESEGVALVWAEILTFAGVLIYIFFAHFLQIAFLNKKKTDIFIKFSYVFAGFSSILLVSDLFFHTSFLVSSVSSKLFFPWYENPGYFHLVIVVYGWIVLLYYILNLMVYSIRNKKGMISQIMFLAVVTSMGFLGGETTRFLIYDINIEPFGVPLVILQLLSVTYYLARYQASDFKNIIRNIYTNISVSIFSFVLFSGGVFITFNYLNTAYSASGVFLIIVLSLVFTIFLIPIIGYVSKSSEVLVFKKFNSKQIIKELFFTLNNASSLEDILKILSENIKKFLGVKDIYIYIFKEYNNKKNFSLSFGDFFEKINIDFNKKPFKNALKQGEIVSYQNKLITDKDFLENIKKKNIKIFAPLTADGKTIGATILGEKISQENYNIEDIEFLEIINTQVASAINRNILFKKKENLIKNLKNKIDIQKNNLKKQNEHLKKILVMRSEFLDIASHQLRTPVTAISGALSMLLEGSIKDEKKEKEFLKVCFEKSSKLTDIIDDILKASTMDDEKIELELKQVDIKNLLIQIFNIKKEEVEKKKLKFYLDLPNEKVSKIIADERYLEEAIVNLINNSIQYTKKGFIKIHLEEDKIQKKVFIKVSDSGIGIPKDDQEKLFKKFSRARNADTAFANGSGLGLFIIKQVADSQKGMEVYIEESETGKGTTITLEMPAVS